MGCKITSVKCAEAFIKEGCNLKVCDVEDFDAFIISVDSNSPPITQLLLDTDISLIVIYHEALKVIGSRHMPEVKAILQEYWNKWNMQSYK